MWRLFLWFGNGSEVFFPFLRLRSGRDGTSKNGYLTTNYCIYQRKVLICNEQLLALSLIPCTWNDSRTPSMVIGVSKYYSEHHKIICNIGFDNWLLQFLFSYIIYTFDIKLSTSYIFIVQQAKLKQHDAISTTFPSSW